MDKAENPYHKSKEKELDQNIVKEPYIAWGLPEAALKISKGLATDILKTVQTRLNLSNIELSGILMISPRTLDRRKKEEKLPPDESERSYRIARLTDLANEVIGGMDDVSVWFKEPNFALNNQKPIDIVKTEPGARLVERVLNQVKHGITV
ncbi:MAG: antitoxin Xre-like helix-turn-helix domain-containing protein [Balneolaceae bacterium]